MVHFKSMMLLLHQGKAGEALDQFRRHAAQFGRLPGESPAALPMQHWHKVSRQLPSPCSTGTR